MALTITDDSATIGTTEWFLASDSGTKVDQTTDCETQLFLNVGAVVAGDTFEVRLYETISGTQRYRSWSFGSVITGGIWISPRLKVGNGWEWSIKKLAGTDRAIGWSIRNDTGGGGGDATAANQTAILARLPAALVSGRIDASVGAMAADVVTASAIAPDAIGSSELAASAVAEIQSGLATAAALATVDGKLPAALVGGRMAAHVEAMSANTVNASAVAADAVAEIQSGLATSANQGSILSGLVAINADTDDLQVRSADLQARIPASLVDGRMDSSVGAMAANVITAAALAADAVAEIVAAIFAFAIETGVTFLDLARDARAVLGGDAADLTTAPKFKDSTGANRVSFTMGGGGATRTRS